jgi:hypothetical protein
MATVSDDFLAARMRRAYEIGRLRRAMRVTLLVIPLVVISVEMCSSASASLTVGACLALLTVGLLWRGQGWGRSVPPGLAAGVAAFALPVVAHAFGYCCRYDLEITVCVAAGVFAGIIAATSALRQSKESERGVVMIGSTLVAALTGALGCLAMGAGGAVAVAIGVLAVTPSIYVVSSVLDRGMA